MQSTNWIGFASYMGSGLLKGNCEIGRYCSIGRNVTIGLGHHDMTAPSTSPWFPVLRHGTMPLARTKPVRRVVIEHDCWIGDNVKISNGVTVGTGSVIATSAVVTKDVAPYSVVGGVPAKVIKMRWDDALIKDLLASRWWEYDPHLLRKVYDADPHVVLDRLNQHPLEEHRFPESYARLSQTDVIKTGAPKPEAEEEREGGSLPARSQPVIHPPVGTHHVSGPALLTDAAFQKLAMQAGHSYRADLVLADAVAQDDLMWELRGEIHIIQRRKLTRGDSKKFVFYTMPSDQNSVSMRIVNKKGQDVPIKLTSLSTAPVDFFDRKPAFEFSDESIVACIATYPPREAMLAEAVQSLVDQVDQVCVYLNGYEHVPDFILDYAKAGRLTYVVASDNALRAAGKFYWMDKPGYFLLCDDDILYPKDYAATMKAAVDSHDREAVMGLMAATFEHDEAGKTRRTGYSAFSDANNLQQRTHLLGTGVMGFHANAVTGFSLDRLLSEPIDNDDIFAVEAQRCGVPLWNIKRAEGWARSNPKMRFGIREEVALSAAKRTHRNEILEQVNIWPELNPAPVKAFIPNAENLKRFDAAVGALAARSSEPLRVMQIGACDGIQFDPLYHLVKKHGLRGIFFEPIRHIFKALIDNYEGVEGCVFMNMAVTKKTGFDTIRYVDPKAIAAGSVPDWSVGLGTLVEGANAIDGAGGIAKETADAIAANIVNEVISTIAFHDLAQMSLTQDVDILVTDAEGFDAYFLEELGKGIMRPSIIQSETMLLSHAEITALRDPLIRCGYTVSCSREYLVAVLA